MSNEEWTRADAELTAKLAAVQREHHGRYGSPRMHAELRKQGLGVSRKRIAGLMKENGLNAKGGRKFIPAADSNRGLPVCGNILDRDVRAAGPGGKRVSDITYLRTPGNWLYLTSVMDLYDRKVIGWPFSADMTAERTAVSAPPMPPFGYTMSAAPGARIAVNMRVWRVPAWMSATNTGGKTVRCTVAPSALLPALQWKEG